MRMWSVLCWLVGFSLFSVVVIAQTQYGFRISFTDKKGTLPLNNPLAFFSQRALDRRVAQNIAVDTTDLPVSPLYIDTVLTLTGGKLHVTSRWKNQCVILLSDSFKILTLQSKPYISAIKYIAVYSPGLHKTTQKNKFSEEVSLSVNKPTGSQTYYGAAWDQTTLVNGDYLHDQGFRGKDKMIAVFDQGFTDINTAKGFDTIRNAGRYIDHFNFMNITPVIDQSYDHGTSCLSLMAGNIPGTYVGAAPDASYAAYVTEIGQGEQEIEWDNMLAATERADSIGVDIISVSLGYNEITQPVYHHLQYAEIDGKTTLAAQAANLATTKGILFVASAGNEGSVAGWNYILTPGDADSAITIGAVDINKNVASNSGYGPNASGRIKPDVCMGGAPAYYLKDGTNVYSGTATSYATPQLAGWAACLWQTKPNATPFAIKDAIIRSAHLYTTPDNHTGYGVPDFKMASQLLLGVKDNKETKVPVEWAKIIPNPVETEVNVKLFLAENTAVDLGIMDISGKILFKQSQNLIKGNQVVSFTTPSIASGIYFLKVVANEKQTILKLVRR